jgi:Ca2+-binding EF-hand superfamily protein
MALDADRDGTISAGEMAGAPRALAALDKNGDGRISPDEIMPSRPDGPGREQAGAAAAPDLVNTLFALDENKDGKLSKEEVPERMQGIFVRADADHDGFLTREELTKATAAQDRAGRSGGPPPDLVFRALDTDQDGTLSATEIAGATSALKTLDKDGDGALSGQELRPLRGPGGPGGRDPREMINHLFEENDANHDGQLTRAEMPERMQEMFERADLNKDGVVTKEEMAKAFENMGPRRQ